MTGSPGRSSTGSPGYLLKRAQSVLHAAMAAALHEHDTTVGQYALLTALDEEPGLSNADLARRAFVTPQTMNQLLRELEHKQWVTRRPHPVHGRILQADLTQQGHAALRSCHQAVNDIEEQMLAGLSPAHRQQLTAALRACVEALSQSRQPAP